MMMKIYQTRAAVWAVFSIVLCFLASPAGAQSWAGSGTSSDPYQIQDINDLNALGADPNYYDAHFRMTADIDLAGNVYTDAVIPYSDTEFTGVFDGNSHIISNLTINTLGANTDYLGLFGYLGSDSVLKNIGVENVAITSGNSSEYIGALAGASVGTIQDCYAKGDITAGNASINVGGTVGANGQTIQNSYAVVDVNAGASSQKIGGMIGYHLALAGNCYAAGSVNGGSAVGGFVGDEDFFPMTIGCYFLDPCDGGGPDNGIGTALTDAQMRLQSSFVGWDFFGEVTNGTDEIWMMDIYPVLAWQVPVGFQEFALMAQFWTEPNCLPGQLCSTVDWFTDGRINIKDLAQLVDSWLKSQVATDAPIFGDDFETGDFSALPWIHGGSADWVIDSNTVFEGNYSARSGPISDSSVTSIEFTIDTLDYDLVNFRLKVSSESGDNLKFTINGVNQGEWSGEVDWTEVERNFPPSERTFKWEYRKDSSGSDGNDCAWIDNIRFLKIEEP
jgi:hypothetical protein